LNTLQPLNIEFLGRQNHLIQKVTDDLMADGGDAHFLALPDEFAHHTCTGVCFSGTGRPLDRQYRLIEQACYALGGIDRGLFIP